MSPAVVAILFGLIVFVTHFIQGVTGFGCAILAMPFCILLVGIGVARPVLTVLALVLDVYLLVCSWKQVDWRQYLHILLFVLPGLPVGMIAYNVLPGTILQRVLAVFMVIVGVQGLLAQTRFRKAPSHAWPAWLLDVLLFLGGAIQGAFTSGGPPVIIYATQKIRDKGAFRATLVAIWTTLNVFIIGDIIARQELAGLAGRLVLSSLPFLVLGGLLGDLAHRRISGEAFTRLIYAVLLVSAVFMVL
jgi:uncharacterized membrane protein YfcA